jgi:hypothetical protein
MHMSLTSALIMAQQLASQVDPNKGTAAAAVGSVKRLQDPTYYDAIFPFVAFFLVIIVPATVALWVIYRTVTETTMEEGET